MNTYDVCICGGGLAGLTLARQLRLRNRDLSIIVLDKYAQPRPEAAFKVGESTVVAGAAYLQNVLQLKDYLRGRQLEKLGLRYFFGDSRGPLSERPELGKASFSANLVEWQLDRGRLENDLFQMNVDDGVEIVPGVHVENIEISKGDVHRAFIRSVGGDEVREVAARWMIDAMGRRRYLQKKLDLNAKIDSDCSASWWRYEGRIDVSDLVPASDAQWHDRVPGKMRYYSTNHLMGDGYWVWLIPLSGGTDSGSTSIGIVASESIHPLSEFNTYERAMGWVREHEPILFERIKDLTPMDFITLRRYSLSSKQVVSSDRWACTGEAGCFIDPFYSPGTNAIGYMNSLICEIIRLDREGSPRYTEALCKQLSDEYIEWAKIQTWQIQTPYRFYGHNLIAPCKIIWTLLGGLAMRVPHYFKMLFNEGFLDLHDSTALPKDMVALDQQMFRFLLEWKERSKDNHKATFDWIDYAKISAFKELAQSATQPEDGPHRMWRESKPVLEKMAHAIFLIALEDVLPDEFRRMQKPMWLNCRAMSLDPGRWDQDGLFRPDSPPMDWTATYQEMRSFVRF